MDYAAHVAAYGYAVLPNQVSPETLDALAAALAELDRTDGAVRRRGESRATYAIRNLLTLVPEVQRLASTPRLLEIAQSTLGDGAFPVRGLLFDKTPEANWRVGWHQDTAIPLRAQRDVPGFSGWSTKAGVLHADAPAEVLDRMLAIRVHLDDCGAANAPLQVLSGSHRFGRIESTPDALKNGPTQTLTVQRGDLILMKPLTLHASLPSSAPGHRRVIHLEYARGPLPGGLEWGLS